MDAYEATKIVFSRIQSMDPENAAKIMGLLLVKDHSEKEMIRLAYGPESLLQSIVFNALEDLHLLTLSSPSAKPAPAGTTNNPFLLGRTSRLLASCRQLGISSPSSWPPPSPFSRTNDAVGGGDDRIDDIKLHDQLSFLNDSVVPKAGSEGFYPDDCRSPFDSDHFPYGFGRRSAIGMAPQRRSCIISDLGPGADHSVLCCRPCLFFARGYCKNGSSCRFLHGLPDDALAAGNVDAVVEQEMPHRSNSQRMLTSVAESFLYTPTGYSPQSPTVTGKCLSLLLQKQQSESQRVAAASASAAASAVMLEMDETSKFMSRPRMEKSDFSGITIPGSRQIYLTFPADSTFREEDVSNYFSIYGPVQDVRIPYQQKRMFGFVTFVYPETVKLILAKGNPHFVCDSRVLVKPYKEKGKLPDMKLQRDCRDPYDLQLLGARTLYGSSYQDSLLRRKLEERQELQHAIELQQKRFMDLQLPKLAAAFISPPSPLPCTAATTTNKSQRPESASVTSHADQAANLKEDGELQQSAEHNLPESPFVSPAESFSLAWDTDRSAAFRSTSASSALLASTLLPTTSALEKSVASCFFQIPRYSSGQGAVGL
ncbi:hypothetical protein HPP92_013833 [Vanilla planifolia]|uniref:Uncharacterized protein n=1 Tax=Vanilla planifolia TaxID=51239 RepID=A0A835QZ95_VANPL|nr:hypothetical protein HPP92_013833 [Vanilla planifolia]